MSFQLAKQTKNFVEYTRKIHSLLISLLLIFVYSKMLKYRYKLQGFDSKWTTVVMVQLERQNTQI